MHSVVQLEQQSSGHTAVSEDAGRELVGTSELVASRKQPWGSTLAFADNLRFFLALGS